MRLLIMVLCLVLAAPVLSQAADWTSQFHPYISLEQVYDDNIDLEPDNRKSDWITVVRPGINFSNMRERSGVAFDYNLGWNKYWRDSDLDYISHNASFDAKYMSSSHFNFYLKDIFVRSDDPREREYLAPTSVPNAYVLSTTTERSVYWRNILIPTVEYQFGKEDKIGLTVSENDYKNEDPTIGRQRETRVSPFFAYWLDGRNGISGQFSYINGDFDNSPDLEGQDYTLRYTNRFEQRTSAYVEGVVLVRTFDESLVDPRRDYNVYNPKVGINHAFSRTLSGQLEVGYYWQDEENGPTNSNPTYLASLTNIDQRTTYNITLQGGYYEDYVTSENLGFTKYHRLLVSARHRLERRMFVSLAGNLEYADYTDDRHDLIYGGTAAVGYDILKWLSASVNYTHQHRDSNEDLNDYTDNRIIFSIKAIYN